jgi:hypothetical protein
VLTVVGQGVRGLVAGVTAVGATVLSAVPAATASEETGLPGMCAGRSDPMMRMNAHAGGTPKLVLNLGTDAAGAPTGVLVAGRGADRVQSVDLCRFWQHLPGQEPGHGGEVVEEGATTAHAVGMGTLQDGTSVLVRADVRATEEDTVFRVRHRPLGAHDHEEGHEGGDDGHDDDAWTMIPSEGWAPLDRLDLR